MTPYLAPIDRPKGLILKLAYWFMRRQLGKVPGWLTVFSARMPLAYTTWMGKVYRLNNKLKALAGYRGAGPRARRQHQHVHVVHGRGPVVRDQQGAPQHSQAGRDQRVPDKRPQSAASGSAGIS